MLYLTDIISCVQEFIVCIYYLMAYVSKTLFHCSKIAWKYEDLAATKRSVVAQEEIEKDYLRKYNKYRARTALFEVL